MKVFLDEQLTGLTDFLASLGWDTTNVNIEEMKRSKDYVLVNHAKKNGYIFVTRDEKASQLAELHEVPCVFLSLTKMAEIIHKELQKIQKAEGTG